MSKTELNEKNYVILDAKRSLKCQQIDLSSRQNNLRNYSL